MPEGAAAGLPGDDPESAGVRYLHLDALGQGAMRVDDPLAIEASTCAG
jgi:hypothetical protein